MDRRKFLIGTVGVPVGLAAVGRAAGLYGGPSASGTEATLTAAELSMPAGTPYPLVALPGKGLMGQVYDRPPNYETPVEHLIGTKNYPYTDNEYFYVRFREANVLVLPPESYRLKIGGDAAENEFSVSLDQLDEREQVTIGAVGSCNGEGRGLHRPMIPGMPWAKGDVSCAEWTGVRLADLLHEAGVKDNALHVSFAGGQMISMTKPEYWRSYPIESMRDPDVLIATRMNGEQLPFWNGYPVRLVVPGTWAPTWTKQLHEIQVRSTPHPMEWSGRPVTANKLGLMSLIVTPTDGTKIPVGRPVELTGVAYDSGAGIKAVDISQDDGKTWQPTALERSYGKYTWRVWRANVTFGQTGTQRVLSRATNNKDKVQPLDPMPDVYAQSARKDTGARVFAGVYEVV